MTTVIDILREKARQSPRRIIFPETHDERVVLAIDQLRRDGLVECIALKTETSLGLPDGIETVTYDDEGLLQRCIEQYVVNRAHKGLQYPEAERTVKSSPLLFAALLVKTGVANGSVAGSVATTAEVLRAGIHGVGADETGLVSSFFLMQLKNRAITYADCGVIPDPNAEELASIAMSAASNHERLTGEIPKVALLSFSTRGSASHPKVDKVRSAVAMIQNRKPSLLVDGELQFDAAFVRDIGARKAPGSPVAGQANVFIFPDLDSGNIAYKITERLGGAAALGPLVQGLQMPCMDLSRGCSVSDIVDVAVIASLL